MHANLLAAHFMSYLINALLLLLILTSTSVVLTRTPRRQGLAMAANGCVLSALFMTLQAPDVAFSEIVVGTVALPLFFYTALSGLRTGPRSDPEAAPLKDHNPS